MNQPLNVVKIEKSGNRFNAWDTNGVKRTSEITTVTRRKAFEGDYLLGEFVMKNGKHYWKKVENVETAAPVDNTVSSVEVPSDHEEVLNFIHSSYSLKPAGLMMTELKWKYLIRSAVRGKNIMMTGPA